jgi:hypothetical protein
MSKALLTRLKFGISIFLALCLTGSGAFVATAQAAPLPVETASGTLEANDTWAAGSVYYIPSSVIVPDGITLTIEAGAIVKTGSGVAGIVVQPGGTLGAAGTSENPVIFTSYADDSQGGDSNNDDVSTGAQDDYTAAIETDGGTLNLSYAMFDYGSYAISSAAEPCSAMGAAIITDSTFHSGVSLEYCADAVSMQRNAFALPSGYVRMPLVAKGVGDASNITLSGANSNTFSGSSTLQTTASLDGFIVPGESTWEVGTSTGLAALNLSNGIITGTLTLPEDFTLLGGSLFVLGGTVNVGAGSVVKVADSADGFNVNAGGTLNVAGTSEKPVIFTSQRDDSAGGDTNNDGEETAPSEADYNRLIVNRGGSHTTVGWAQIRYVSTAVQANSGTVELSNVQTSYATDGIIATGTSDITYRGSFANLSDRAVVACSWSGFCSVDATYTGWGSDEGPLPAEGAPLICGAVTYNPWLTSTGTESDGDATPTPNCGSTNS